MARDKLGKYLNSVHGTGQNSISYNLKDSNDEPEFLQQYRDQDLTTDPKSGADLLDLENSDTGLIGDYLKYIMDNFSPNDFALKGKNYKSSETNRGDPISTPEDTGAEKVFAASNTTGGTELGKYSDSGKFSEDLVDKTAGSDGHGLLKGVIGSFGNTGKALDSSGVVRSRSPTFESEIVQESEGILETYNRFAPTSRVFSEKSKTTKEADADPIIYPQRDLGDYVKGSESESFGYESLLDIAASLMAKSAGWDTQGEKPGTSRDPSKIVPSANPAAYESTQIATGRKIIPPEKLRSKNTYGTPTKSGLGESYREGRGAFLVDNDEEADINSFGTVYTPDNKFDDASSSTIVAAQAIASLVAVSALGSSLMTDVIDALDTETVPLGRGPFLNGVFGNNVDANARAFKHLLLVPTHTRSFSTCVNRGIKILFDNKIKSLESLGNNTGAALNDVGNKASSMITDSPGYWLAVCRGILRNVDEVVEESASAAVVDFSSIENLVRLLGSNKLLAFFKYLASIGDISLSAGMGTSIDNTADGNSYFNVDKLPDGPATRVGKSRSSSGNTATSLAWRGNSVPSVYLLPKEILKATTELGTGGYGTNPAKGMLATSLWDKTYMTLGDGGEGQRIPSDVVERMENMLDSEYCPFYFHDIRTNEIVAFHAFLSTLTDTFSPHYSDMKGYGRMDPVQIYSNTTRNIGLSFIIAATSQEDFDEMWFKINKLVTLVYPQYSRGTKVRSNDNSTFTQPFSQVLKSSPMIRLRVGDVIKGNYSKFNLARTFGIGTDSVSDLKGEASGLAGTGLGALAGKATAALDGLLDDFALDLFLGAYGSPLGLGFMNSDKLGAPANRALRAAASQILVNGFGNPILSQVIGDRLRDPDSVINTAPKSNTLAAVADGLLTGNKGGLFEFGFMKKTIVFLKPTDGKPYKYTDGDDEEEVRFNRPVRGIITNVSTTKIDKKGADNMKATRTTYSVQVNDLGAPTQYYRTGNFHVNHSDLIMDPAFMFNIALLPVLSLGGALDMVMDSVTNEAALAAGVPADTLDISVSDTANFFSSYDNPIVKAFNSSRGRGLAGFIRRLSIKHLDSSTTWETDWNSRAPKFVKVEMGFSPIHDIQPGIDSQGFNRAPVYNVGRSMEYVAGDPYDDNGLASKFKFRNDGRATFKSKKITED